MADALQRRDRQVKPSQPSRIPSQLCQSYLILEEVNAHPAMPKCCLKWVPAQSQVRPKQEVRQLGWKGAIQAETRRVRARHKALRVLISNLLLANELSKYAVAHDIKTDGQIYPSANYMQNHVMRHL
jgi:hypothetical protein